ncbi:DUF6801 domain-containing protein [Actinokineospora spheciospongiae]|uniref:DUF6801 domain-containing protein n=1 Tax=Actinokineospora spheciospongiae TaxID=909613 RepID=UPI000D97F7DA|nr:DUF6801 domain-containing protein [Actinokineospora spheciospongiae]PWW65511.1 hypothetical protein DFQ13_102263 [Actinokineospora spheciospongiae]
MSPRKVSRKLVAALAATTTSGLVAAGLVLGTGSSGAVPVSLTLNYTCPFPLIGNQAIKAVITTDLPASVGIGEPTGEIKINAVTTVPETATQGLTLVGATTVEGTALAASTVAAPGITLPVNVPITVPKTNVPASGAFDVPASGSAPSLSFTQPGEAKITVGDLKLTLTPKTATGAETGLGTFDSACTQVPGQNNLLHTFTIANTTPTWTTTIGGTPPPSTTTTPPPITSPSTPPTLPPGEGVDIDYGLSGSSTLPRLGGTVPLSGSVDAKANLGQGTFTAALALNKTKGDFKIVGVLPATAEIDFEMVGQGSGTMSAGAATFQQQLYVKLTSVSIFGLPIYSGDTCRTQKPADIKLASSGTFDPLGGGKLKGTYSLTRADGCGPLNDYIGPFVFSQNNTIDVTLAAK